LIICSAHSRTVLDPVLRHNLANPASGACDDGDSLFNVEHFQSPFF